MTNSLYFSPTSIDDALKLLADYDERATVLAGGTDIVPQINYYELQPEILVYIGKLGLDYIKETNDKLVIGATTPTAILAIDRIVTVKAGILAEAARRSGSIPIRNAATIGGNLANASPAADLATPLLAADAQLLLASQKGSRTVNIKDFFVAPGETILRPDELVVEIHFPFFKGKSVFFKLGRRKAMTLSVVNVAVRIETTNEVCTTARIALGSVAPTPIRCTKAEEMLQGKSFDERTLEECAALAIAESNPIDDERATAWYRKKAGKSLIKRALAQATGIDLS